jgi:hypothetical protein
LIASLDEAAAEPSAIVAASWRREVAQRAREVEQGTAPLIDWPTAKRQVLRSLPRPATARTRRR